MRTPLLISTLILSATASVASTRFDTPLAWETAVVNWNTEDFEHLPEMRLPVEGGSTNLGSFTLENDSQGSNPWTGLGGLYLGQDWPNPRTTMPPESMNLVISTELGTPRDPGGPFEIDAVFPQPIIALALDYSWCEFDNDECQFVGFVFDQSVTRVSLWEPLQCEHKWCAIQAVRWVSNPEPGTGLLLALGLVLLRVLR